MWLQGSLATVKHHVQLSSTHACWPQPGQISPVPSPHVSSGKKQLILVNEVESKLVRTNENLWLVIITFPYRINFYVHQICHKIFWTLLSYTVTKAHASPKNLTWFTRLFLLVRGWRLGMRLGSDLLLIFDQHSSPTNAKASANYISCPLD